MTDSLILQIPEELNKASHPAGVAPSGAGCCVFIWPTPTKAVGWELFHYRECSWLYFPQHSLKCLNGATIYSSPHCYHKMLLQVSIKPVSLSETAKKITCFKKFEQLIIRSTCGALHLFFNFKYLSAQMPCNHNRNYKSSVVSRLDSICHQHSGATARTVNKDT